MKSILIAILCFRSVLFVAQPVFDRQSIVDFQKDLNANFSNPARTPLMEKDFYSFKTHDFFPIDSSYFVIARIKRTPKAKPFMMETSTEQIKKYVQYATLHFSLNGTECKLNLYRNVKRSRKAGYEITLFLPFSDLTTGKQTNRDGRYMDVKVPEGDTMAIDFNMAYNPYCAYSPRFSCPKIPHENTLPVAIKAGVKKFHD